MAISVNINVCVYFKYDNSFKNSLVGMKVSRSEHLQEWFVRMSDSGGTAVEDL